MKFSYCTLTILFFTLSVIAQDYVSIAFTPSHNMVNKNDSALFEISLTPLNGFNATVELSTSAGDLTTNSINPPILDAVCSLWIAPEDIIESPMIIEISAKNGVTDLGTGSCTLSVTEPIDVYPMTCDTTDYKDTATFVVSLKESAKNKAQSLGEQFFIVTNSDGRIDKDTLWYLEDDEINLMMYAVDEYNISELKLEGFPNKTSFTVKCTSYVNFTWTLYDLSNSELKVEKTYAIKEDKFGNIWLAQGSATLTKIDTNDVFTFYQNPNINNDGFVDLEISEDNKIWLATSYKGVLCFDGTFWTSYNTDNSNLISNKCRGLEIDNDGNIWVYSSDGVMKFDGSNWTSYNGFIRDSNVSSLLIDSKNTKWLGVSIKTNYIDKLDDGNWSYIRSMDSTMTDHCIGFIEEDSKGNLWVSHRDRMYGMNGYMSKFDGTNWTSYPVIGNIGEIRSIEIDAFDNIWFGIGFSNNSAEYLYRYDGKKVTRFDTYTDELFDSTKVDHDFGVPIYDIFSDSKERLWVGTPNGVIKYSPKVDFSTDNKVLPIFSQAKDGISIVGGELFLKVGNSTNIEVSIFDIKGRIIKSHNIRRHTNGLRSLDFLHDQLAVGIYIVRVNTDSNTFTTKYRVE